MDRKLDDSVIIYLALNNQLIQYKQLLEEEDLDPDNRGMAEYIFEQTNRLSENYQSIIESDGLEEQIEWTEDLIP